MKAWASRETKVIKEKVTRKTKDPSNKEYTYLTTKVPSFFRPSALIKMKAKVIICYQE